MKQQISQPAFFLNHQRFAKTLKNDQSNQTMFTTNNQYFLYTNKSSTAQKSTLNMHPRKSIKENTLETEGPLSEKDEVKKAEQRTMQQQKKVDKKPSGKDKK